MRKQISTFLLAFTLAGCGPTTEHQASAPEISPISGVGFEFCSTENGVALLRPENESSMDSSLYLHLPQTGPAAVVVAELKNQRAHYVPENRKQPITSTYRLTRYVFDLIINEQKSGTVTLSPKKNDNTLAAFNIDVHYAEGQHVTPAGQCAFGRRHDGASIDILESDALHGPWEAIRVDMAQYAFQRMYSPDRKLVGYVAGPVSNGTRVPETVQHYGMTTTVGGHVRLSGIAFDDFITQLHRPWLTVNDANADTNTDNNT